MVTSNHTSQQSYWKRVWQYLLALSRRYVFPEIGGTISALSAASLVHHITHSLAAAALAGAIGEVVGFYGVATVREIRHYYQKHIGIGSKRIWLTAYHSLRGLAIEFGLAEFIDSIFVRPFTLYYGSKLITYNLLFGWFVGKLAADIVFLILASIGLAARRRLFAIDRV